MTTNRRGFLAALLALPFAPKTNALTRVATARALVLRPGTYFFNPCLSRDLRCKTWRARSGWTMHNGPGRHLDFWR